MKIGIIGSGSWGCANAVMLASYGFEVYLWSYKQEESDLLNTVRENKKCLPGIRLPENVICTGDIGLCTDNADLLLIAVPSPAVRATARLMRKHVKNGQIILNLSKGLESNTLKTLSCVLSEELPQAEIAVMSGPSHAEEVSRGLPTTNVVAARDLKTAEYIQKIIMGEYFRIYTSTDILGVELGGALKNVIALCAGISDGLGYGDNTKAALITRGIAEISRLGTALGARPETFAGLSGIGDLIVTCTSMHSRNRRAGILIGQGKALDETLSEIGMVAEGVNTAAAALSLAEKYNVSMPITKEANLILFSNKNPKEAVYNLMMREKKSE